MSQRFDIITLMIPIMVGFIGCQTEIDPKNPGPATQQALNQYMKTIGGQPHAWKSTSYRDLNQDGHLEAITLTNDPKLCSPEGCPLLIFENKDKKYRFLSKIDNVKSLRGESKVVNGWKSLVVTTGTEGQEIFILPFKKGYPSEASQGIPKGGRFNDI